MGAVREFEPRGWLLRAVVECHAKRVLDQMDRVQEQLPPINVDIDWFSSRGYVMDFSTPDELPVWCRGLIQNPPPAYEGKPIRLITAMSSSVDRDGSRGGLLEATLQLGKDDLYGGWSRSLKIIARSAERWGQPAGIEISVFPNGEMAVNSDNMLVPVRFLAAADVHTFVRGAQLAAQVPSDLLDLFKFRRPQAYTQAGYAYGRYSGMTAFPIYNKLA